MAASDELTASERYLAKLCRDSFLSLWSWPRPYRDQRGGGRQEGKEICDLLVVFDRHLLIFSDKYCEFPHSGDLNRDWARWFKRAVLRSAKQLWGAERWLLEHQDRVFVDKKCTIPFRFPLPASDKAIVHRIAVAHGSAERCVEELGQTASLMIRTDLEGNEHLGPQAGRFFSPFVVGNVDPAKGFVHVFDDSSLDTVLKTLDTITDFVHYLERREGLLTSGRRVMAAGEEELLAFYLKHMGADGRHDFGFPKSDAIWLDEGFWDDYQRHPDRLAQVKADEISYAWDGLIEKFTHHILTGTQEFTNTRHLGEDEIMLRFLAREPRAKRRMLAKALIGAMKRGRDGDRMLRVIEPSPGSPTYVFLTLKQPSFAPLDEYREVRRRFLDAALMVTKLRIPEAEDIVGIATEPMAEDPATGVSEDLAYLDARVWSKVHQDEARKLQSEFGILVAPKRHVGTEHEYPLQHQRQMTKGRNRNTPCTCGSGLKYKKCCGRRP